jgi:biotin-dependent carboxylase-like uncharacterized protein
VISPVITVVRSGPLTTVQDLGRPGYAHLGVPRSGALDMPALRHANALVGNPPDAAVLETTLLGCALRFESPARVAVTGASAVIKLDGRAIGGVLTDHDPHGESIHVPDYDPRDESIHVPAGGLLDVGRARRGVRSYVAVAGGIAVEPVLGSRSTDILSGLGPPRLAEGMTLPIGTPSPAAGNGRHTGVADSPHSLGSDILELSVLLGPRDDWFDASELFGNAYTVSPVSNRVACRLAGTSLNRTKAGELDSEGLVLGAIQVPPDGQPLIFLADHPTTGGYPVIGVVDDVTPLAQARPGTTVRFRAHD